jgi:hypothetical protein
MGQDRQPYVIQQEKIPKNIVDYGKSRILVARQHFSMELLWRQLREEFFRFVNSTRPSGWRGNFYQIAQGQLLSVIMRSFDY